MNQNLYTVLALFLITFVLTVVFERILIPILKRYRAAQPILEIGPHWHLSKAGTPTMGGLAFIVSIGIALLLLAIYLRITQQAGPVRAMALVFAYGMLCAAIGFYDDYRKLIRQKNQGLTATQKYLLQLVASAGFIIAARLLLGVQTAIALPFSNVRLELGFFYYPLALLFLTGLVNACNLTDGVDGLLSTTVGVVAIFLVAWAAFYGGELQLWVGGVLLGGACGFLCFNAHPAKVFMGDTGSLFFGGILSAVGLVSGNPVIVLVACGAFALEALSVIAQVLWFKLSKGRRLLRMAPLHHHFEKCGWSEWRVVAVFSLVGLLCAMIALMGV